MSPVAAPPDQREDVNAVFELLDRVGHQRGQCRIVGPDGREILIPESMFYAFERVAEVLALGDAVTVLRVPHQLTTQQAANILNVSRQDLVRLIEDGKLPSSNTGKHRRIRVGDLLDFKRRRDRDRSKALDALAELSQEMGGYDEIP